MVRGQKAVGYARAYPPYGDRQANGCSEPRCGPRRDGRRAASGRQAVQVLLHEVAADLGDVGIDQALGDRPGAHPGRGADRLRR